MKIHKKAGVIEVETTNRNERTRRNVGVGSTQWQVRERVPGVSCRPYRTLLTRCRVGTGDPNTRVTDFVLRDRVLHITLAVIPDKIPPSTPRNLVVTGKTRTSISVAWAPSTRDVGVTSYGLYRDGLRIGGTRRSSTTIKGLACSASYRLGVDAEVAGNRSLQATVRASTAACPSLGDLYVSPTRGSTPIRAARRPPA